MITSYPVGVWNEEGEVEMSGRSRRKIRIRACQRCGGDAFATLDVEETWACLQCGRFVAAEGRELQASDTRHVAA